MLEALLIDDELRAHDDFMLETATITNLTVIEKCTSVAQAVEFIEGHGHVDMIICDVQMPELSGLDALKRLRPFCDYFIFLTAYPDYTNAAFESICDAYLTKPLCCEELLRRINNFIRIRNSGRGKSLIDCVLLGKKILKDNGKEVYVPVKLREIAYFGSMDNYVFFTKKGEPETKYILKTSLKEILGLYNSLFLKASRFALVAKDHIDYISDKTAHLKDGLKVSLTDTVSFFRQYRG